LAEEEEREERRRERALRRDEEGRRRQPSAEEICVRTKSAGVAVVLEIVPGLFIQIFRIGNMYIGNVGFGLFLMFGYWLLLLVNFALLFCCGIGVVTWVFFCVVAMVVSTVTAASAASSTEVVNTDPSLMARTTRRSNDS
jgi:hypothetical protein